MLKDYNSIKICARLCHQLASHLDQGGNLLGSLSLLVLSETDKPTQQKIKTSIQNLKTGSQISGFLDPLLPTAFPLAFSRLNQLPSLPEFLKSFAGYLDQKTCQVSETAKILVYPGFLLFLSLIMLGFSMQFLLPNFIGFFETIPNGAPKSLLQFLALFDGIKSMFPLGFFTVFGIFCLLDESTLDTLKQVVIKHCFPYQRWDVLLLLGLYYKNGCPLRDLDSVISIPNHHPLNSKFKRFRDDVRTNATFVESLTQCFDLSASQEQMLKFHSDNQTLGIAFSQLAEELRLSDNHRWERWLKLIPCLVYLCLSGVLILFFYITFLPLMNITAVL